jgi:receptor-binding and translocation channel-forming TcA subunit of Tc toxin
MATKVKTTRRNRQARPVEAAVLGSTQAPPIVREALLHPDPAPLHAVPKEPDAEVALARVESLLGKGHFGAALREAGALNLGDTLLAGHYEFVRHEKRTRAQIGIAERYVLRGDVRNARRYYERALKPDTGDATVLRVADVANKAFDELTRRRGELIRGLRRDIENNDFAQWCGRKKTLHDVTVLDLRAVRERIYPDFRLEHVFTGRPPIEPDPGFLDSLPPETDAIAFSSAVPGALFRAATDSAVDIDASPAAEIPDVPDNKVRASLAMPLLANILAAKAGLFAIDNGLSVTGRADNVVPLFRYEHLRDKAKELIAHIQTIEVRMLPIQFELDDFAEAMDAFRRPLATQQAELEAVKQRIAELVQNLADLVQAEKALNDVVIALDKAEAACACDWFCGLVSYIGMAIAVSLAVIIATMTFGAAALLVIGGLIAVIGTTGLSWTDLTYDSFTCEKVGVVGRKMRTALAGVRGTIADNEAELSHALITRDILIASINALAQQLEAAYQSNAARVLDAKTLDAIQSQYNHLRQSLLTRAQTVARMAQNSFNFERDSQADLIRDAYYDPSRKGYTAAETLLHDLSGLDLIDLTGRTNKAMQLSHMYSVRKHNPIAFVAIAAIGSARFTTDLREFDRWYPGTYLQRIKEVRVEVMIGDEIVPVRGYISNDGVSLVRFADSQNKRPIDNIRVFPEPEADIAKLCYKRLQRRRHVDTMAFPEFKSALHDERMKHIQSRERNVFENVGLDSTWTIELLPDQPFDLKKITDVRVWFQYEALFDGNLKRVLLPKRYAGRREMAMYPVGRLARERGEAVDFSSGVTFRSSIAMFDAPAMDKKIVNAGFVVRLKDAKQLNGGAELEVSFAGSAPAALTTDTNGIVATASEHSAGTGLNKLAAIAHGKSVEGTWTIRVDGLPSGVAMATSTTSSYC